MTDLTNSSKAAEAAELFRKGYNCSQAVAGAWSRDINLPFETLITVSSGFGGGMGRMGEVCGAVTGAFMVLGAAYSSGEPGAEPKKEMYEKIQEFTSRFREEADTDTIICREMLKSFSGSGNVQDKRHYCLRAIMTAAALLEEFITPETVKILCRSVPKVKITAFGNFAVYADGNAVRFKRSKSCEALAYLVDRRTPCTKKQIAAVLFEDRVYDRSCQKYADNILRGLISDLKEAGVDNLVIHTSNSYSINPDACICDYYDYLNGIRKVRMIDEYMSQYSWAEETLALLG